MRALKSEEEILFLRRSGYIADKGIEAMIDSAHIGANDLDIVYAIDLACAKAGAPPGGFQIYRSRPWGELGPNVWSDSRSARSLQSGDLLIPEVGSNYKGYFTQLTVPVAMGDPGPDFRAALNMNRAINREILWRFRLGITVRELDNFSAEYCQDFSDGEFTTLFAVQCGEHERAFVHDDYTLASGMLGYIQPYFIRVNGEGGPFHVLGNAVVCTEGEPLHLHHSEVGLVIV
jgi:Xaa-Pro aminopeptidase